MKRWWVVLTAAVLLAAAGFWWYQGGEVELWADPKGRETGGGQLLLSQYDFNELRKRGGIPGEFEMLDGIPEVENRRKTCRGETCLGADDYATFTTTQFRYKSNGKWITGMINIPFDRPMSWKYPTVIMLRGYADKPGYYSGSGSWHAADWLASRGYVTVSTDFLGYAQSDDESTDMLEARFEKVVAVLDLIATLEKTEFVDKGRMGIWAHSNGGQIALSVLEITGKNYPTTLWAPMTNPFPQSVLDTASDLDDGGKAVIQAISEFQKHYDARRYAFENYYDWVKAPVQIHQGTADVWCRVEWQEEVVAELKQAGKEASLMVYPGDDHNFSHNWREVMEKDIEFFSRRLLSGN